MKKNKMMRIASGLLVLNLMSTCAISGTFAKYVTRANNSDTARVAKWGVSVTTGSDLFSTTYAKDDMSATTISNSVESSDTDKVVAPGTAGGTMSFTVAGTPEVAVRVTYDLTYSNDVLMPAGDYTDYTEGDAAKRSDVTLNNDYHPLVYTLKQGETVISTGRIDEIETALEALNADYPAGTPLDSEIGTYTLTWNWGFQSVPDAINNADKLNVDVFDTFLGMCAAGDTAARALATTNGVVYDGITVGISVEVVQID